jgi:hypothetical protein
MGCGCKKRQNNPAPQVTVHVTEGQPQEPNAMEQQVDELVKKIEEINKEN